MEPAERVIVRFFKRTNERFFNASIKVEDPSEQAERHRSISVHFGSRSRDTGRRMSLPGFGDARIMAFAGLNKSMLAISLGGERLREMQAMSDVVKDYVRSMRGDDAAGLAVLDGQIAEAQARLRDLRRARINHLHDAFARGHVVTIKSLVERAEAVEAAR